jgi:hypothetical protein
VRRRQIPATANIAFGSERERLFEVLALEKPNVARYRERAATYGRDLPLVVVRPKQSIPTSR